MSFNAYNCFVRPAGNLMHEVPKQGISAAEIQLLRFLHGADAVVRITNAGKFADYNREEDLRRLAREYGANVVQKVFQTIIEPMNADLTDDEALPQYVAPAIVERESAGEQVDPDQVAVEAGPARPAPQKVDTEPFYVGSPEEQAAAREANEGRNLE